MKTKLGKHSVTAAEAASLCGGRIIREGRSAFPVTSFCTDSRDAAPGSLFLAIPGARTDGHLYIGQAAAAGATAILCERDPGCDTGDAAVIAVESTVAAVGRFAAAYGKDSCAKRIAVTGSVGKTATKEMIYSTLSASGRRVFRSEGNLNTVIGMPLSFISAPAGTDFGIFEMGLELKGEIAAMSDICRPDTAAVTVLGSSHIGNIGSRKLLAAEKLGVASGLAPDGCLLLPAGEPLFAEKIAEDERVMTFSASGRADITAVNILSDGEKIRFDAFLPRFDRYITGIRLPVPGLHNASNALIAVAVGVMFGLDDDAVREGLASYVPVKLRQQILRIGGFTMLNDCYNASPESMKAAFALLRDMALETEKKKCRARRFALLGDMYELGESALELHRETGRNYAASGGDFLITVGRLAEAIAEGAAETMPADRIFVFPDIADLKAPAELLSGMLEEGDLLLVKASRAVGAERIAEKLREIRG